MLLYGVYNLYNHQVSMPNNPFAPIDDSNVCLALAPSNPREFAALGLQMAEILKPLRSAPAPEHRLSLKAAEADPANGKDAHAEHDHV